MPYIGNAPGQKDIAAYTNIGAQPAGSDELLLSDAGVLKAVTVDNLIAGAGGGKILQIVYANETDQVSGSTTVSNDNTIMQNDEGVEMMTVTITPTSATSKILITGSLYVCVQTGDKHQTSGLFLDTDAGAVWGNSRYQKDGMSSGAGQLVIQYLSDAIGDTSAHTYKVRAGADSGSTYLNSGAGSGVMCGAVLKSTLTAWEIGA